MMFNGDELQDSRDPRLPLDCRETHIVQFWNFITHGLGGGELKTKFYLSMYLFMKNLLTLHVFYYRVDLWNASNLKFGDEFLGELRLPLKFLRQSSSYEAWYLTFFFWSV